MYRVFVLTVAIAMLGAWPAAADVACDDLGVGVTFGMMQPTGGDNDYEDSGLMIGLMVRKPMSDRVALQVDYKHGETRSGELPEASAQLLGTRFESWGEPDDNFRTVWNHVGLSGVWTFSDRGKVMPFVSGGLGMTFWEVQDWRETASVLGGVPKGYDTDGKATDLDGVNLTAVLGLGADFFMGENIALTLGGRYYYLVGSDVDNVGFSAVSGPDYVDANSSILEGYVGLAYFFGPGDCDGDGIIGSQDKCWRVPEDFDGFEDDDGCPDPDNDQDGILDVDDQCPDQPEDFDGFQDKDGCPDPDNDGDGVLDADDECPDTPKGTVVMANGCPKPVAKLMAVMVNFDFDKSDLKPDAIAKLDAFADALLEDKDIMVQIAGYADDVGTETYNQALSERRAQTVKAYLVGKGVAESRLSTVGYGEMNPLVPAKTEDARAQNRRVMLTPSRME